MKRLSFFRIAAGLFLLASVQSSRADTPMLPSSPFITTSYDGQCFFKMIPGKRKLQENKCVITSEAFGVAYSIDENGNFNELWKTSGWYSPQVFLSDDGQYLVRMGPWYTQEPNKNDLAVAFYKNGKLLKEYFATDLVKNESKIKEATGRYYWLEDPYPELKINPSDNVFQLKTIDGIVHRFDVTTGENEKGQDPTKKSGCDNFDDANSMEPFKLLEKSQCFRIGGVGYAGKIPPEEIALCKIMKKDNASAVLEDLYSKGSSVGKLYALLGLRFINWAKYEELMPQLRQNTCKIDSQSGCIIFEETVQKIIRLMIAGNYDYPIQRELKSD